MKGHVDLAVIGAGPAGANAAIAAGRAGLTCMVFDEAAAAGGQVYRAPSIDLKEKKPDAVEGDRLRSALGESGATLALQHRVWLVERGFAIHAIGPDGPKRITAERLIVATGTSELVIPFPGWTTPGVIGLAAATILLKADATLPGRRTVIAGRGPLLAAVAAGILDLGGDVVAVLDQVPRSQWIKALPQMVSRPDLLTRGTGWWMQLLRARVPIRHGTDIVDVINDQNELLVRTHAGETFACDSLAVGQGLTPSTEITRLLRARHHFVPGLGGWVAEHDVFGRTTVDGLLVAGDGAGVRGAAAAAIAGELAGLTVAFDLKRFDHATFEADAKRLQRLLARASRFGTAMAEMMAPRMENVDALSPETIVCRCEDIKAAEIETAILGGAATIDQLKAWTRVGMGPCQGRICGETVASLLAKHVGGREQVGMWTGRAPLRPVPVDELIGDVAYEDIPIPKAAPL